MMIWALVHVDLGLCLGVVKMNGRQTSGLKLKEIHADNRHINNLCFSMVASLRNKSVLKGDGYMRSCDEHMRSPFR